MKNSLFLLTILGVFSLSETLFSQPFTEVIYNNPDNSNMYSIPVFEWKNYYYFMYETTAPSYSYQLARFDSSVLTLLTDPYDGWDYYGMYTICNNAIYIQGRNSSYAKYSKFDGTTITHFTNPDNGNVTRERPILWKDTVFIGYTDASSKCHLAKLVGTSVIPVPNPDAGNYSGASVVWNDSLFFGYTNAAGVPQLAKYDKGKIVLMPNPDAGKAFYFNPNPFVWVYPTEYKNALYFAYTNIKGKNQLVRYNGKFTLIPNPDTGKCYNNLIVHNDTMYFSYYPSNKGHLAKFDGIKITVTDNPDNGSGIQYSPQFLKNYVICQYKNSGGKTQYIKYDGSKTTSISNPDNGNGFSSYWRVYNDKLYCGYENATGVRQMSIFDGNSLTLLSNPDNGSGVDLSLPFSYNNLVFYGYTSPTNYSSLAIMDGTKTTLIPNINGNGTMESSNLFSYKNNVYCTYYNFSPAYKHQVIQLIPHDPVITSNPPAYVRVNKKYSYTITSSGSPTISVSGNPAWLNLSGNILSGTPTDTGLYGPVTITATNGYKSVQQSIYIRVTTPPNITSSPATSVKVNKLYTYNVIKTGSPLPVLSVSGNPSWLTLTGNTLSGKPATSGTYGPITITATNIDTIYSQTFSILVTAAPIITSKSTDTTKVNSSYSLQLVATGFPTPAFSINGNPTWLTLSGSTISGKPLSAGTYGPITITATNVDSLFNQTFNLLVTAPPAITSNAPTAIRLNNLYSYTIKTTGYPNPTLTVSGNPSWLTLNGNILSGKPSSIGTYGPITITAKNCDSSVQQKFSIFVSDPPVITSSPITTDTVNKVYKYTITATGTPAPTFSVSGNPSWLTLGGNVLIGVPTSSGTFGPITITATNSDSSAQQQFSIVVYSSLNEKDNKHDIISIYPNPANDYIHVDLSSGNLLHIEVTDILGRTLMNKITSEKEIYIGDLQNGIYFLKVNDAVFRFIKQ